MNRQPFHYRLWLCAVVAGWVMADPVARAQTGAPSEESARRKSPPKLTETQEKSATVSIDPQAVKKYLVERPVLALLGKDPVSLVDNGKEEDGNKEISSRFDGQTYLFTSVEHKGTFEQSPGRYVPVLGGYSPVAWKKSGDLVLGSLAFRAVVGERLVLMANEDEKKVFEGAKDSFAEADLGLQGFSPVVLVEEEVLRRGDKKVEVIFEGRRFRFASATDRDVFAANPGRYYPVLGGIDVVTLAAGKPALGEAKFSVVYKNRLYSFASAETRDQFVAQAEPLSDFDLARGGIDQVARVEGAGESVGHYGISAIHRGLRYLFLTEQNRERFQQDPETFLTAATGSGEPVHSTDPKAPAKPATTNQPSQEVAPKTQEKSSPAESPLPTTPKETEPTQAKPPADAPKAADADPNIEEPEPVK
jgi:YHS domain-containing protein